MVDEEQFNQFKQQLLARQKKIMDLIRPRTDQTDGKANQSVDQQAQLEWSQINKALKRIEAGTFGQCVVCGEAITHARLSAYPHTPFCGSCVNP